MATIQIKRRTSTGTGPLIGAVGSLKAGEPLVDLNGTNLYVAKSDKVASTSNPLTANDYIEYLSKPNTETLINSRINALGLGTAATRNTGNSNGNVPLIGSDGKLPASILPNTSPVLSVNNKTGAVQISLSELGGVDVNSFNEHINNNSHLTPQQRNRINSIKNIAFHQSNGASFISDENTFESSVVKDGLFMHNEHYTDYDSVTVSYRFGINKDKVLTPTSVIDGGTY